MIKTVQFSHTEFLYPSLPGMEIPVEYRGEATIELNAEGLEVGCRIEWLDVSIYHGRFEDVPVPSAEITEGNRFLAPLREAARKALREIA